MNTFNVPHAANDSTIDTVLRATILKNLQLLLYHVITTSETYDLDLNIIQTKLLLKIFSGSQAALKALDAVIGCNDCNNGLESDKWNLASQFYQDRRILFLDSIANDD